VSWKRIAMALILAGLSCALKAEEPRRLADINVGAPDPLDDSLFPAAAGFVAFGNRLIFSVQGTGVDDIALWSSDGTPGGTAPLPVSFCDGLCESLESVGVVKGGALLAARANGSGSNVTHLWRTDGTAAGTFPLTGPVGFLNERLVFDDPSRGLSVFYFTSCPEPDRCLLWRTDGSRAGTWVVREFLEGESGHGPHDFRVWNGRLVFIANDGEGSALWITDGTSEGTVRLAPIPDDERGAFFTQALAATPSRFFFTSGYLSELWVTDGTPEGTRRLRAFQEAACPNHYYCEDPYTDALVAFGDEVYFTAAELGDEKGKVDLWRSDGTEEGTVRVTHLPLPPEGRKPSASTLRRTGSRWFFVVGSWSGGSLWASEGDLAAAAPVTGCEGGCPQDVLFVGTLDAAGRQLFEASDAAHGTELWVTDGTGAGTRRLTDACPGPCSGFAGFLGAFPGGTYFLAYPRAGEERPTELWVTDGTPGDTRRVAGRFSGLAAFQGSTWFSAPGEDPFSVRIWRTDGTPAGTSPAVDLRISAPGSSPMIFPRRGGGALMLAWDGHRRRLWRSDGTPRGTVRLGGLSLDPELDSLDTDPLQIGPLQFLGVTRQKGDPDDPKLFYEIWRTDGTTRGTFRLLELDGNRFFWDLPAAWNGRFLFEVEDAGHCSFWASDGTAEGTRELFPLRADSRCALDVRPLGPGFLFLARVPGRQGTELTPQLFYSDGTAAGTRQLSRITGNRDGFGYFLQAGGTILFLIPDVKGELELWRTDGTAAGTRRIGPPPPDSLEGVFYSFRGILYELVTASAEATSKLWRIPLDGGSPVLLQGNVVDYGGPESGTFSGLALAGDRVLFTAWDEAHGAELWSTDGTPGGTKLLRDILPGGGSSQPAELTAVGGRVFFSANDGEHGWELWQSDGTPEGTRMVTDLRPGLFGSLPLHLVSSGPNLYFSADDEVSGREPWVLSLLP
jgi:ELWxxDGT repeat protein